MQSGHRNVDEMKYTIANITMNILVSLFNQAARMSPSSIRRGWRWDLNQRRYDIRAPYVIFFYIPLQNQKSLPESSTSNSEESSSDEDMDTTMGTTKQNQLPDLNEASQKYIPYSPEIRPLRM